MLSSRTASTVSFPGPPSCECEQTDDEAANAEHSLATWQATATRDRRLLLSVDWS